MTTEQTTRLWERLQPLLEQNARDKIADLIDGMTSREIVHTFVHLREEDQLKLLRLLPNDLAAEVLEEIPDSEAADIIEDLEAHEVVAILNEMPSDERVDLLAELGEEAEEIISKMEPETASDLRRMIEYHAETAGGLMITEFLSYTETTTISEVIEDLRTNAEEYQNYRIRYIYVTDAKGQFCGILQMQDLLLAEEDTRLEHIMHSDPFAVRYDATMDELVDFFDQNDFFGVPVVDERHFLMGVVLRRDVLEAQAEQAAQEHLESQGIVGGDEIRTMPVLLRSKRRLSWLSVNILLNIVAASVIAYHQDVLSSVIALAVFLPIISDMSGCSGNQAVAVSMRELSLGVVRPGEALRVWYQEVSVGVINGTVLGILIGIAAWIWKGNIILGGVVGAALAINTIVAVSIGGTVPLLLKKFNMDPALASGPILTTITDMFGFFLALTFASLTLTHISGL